MNPVLHLYILTAFHLKQTNVTIHGIGSYARMYVLLVYMKDTLFSTVRNFFISTALRKNPCHTGRVISVVYSERGYVTRRRLNYVSAKCILASLTSVKMEAFLGSGRFPKPSAQVPSPPPNEISPNAGDYRFPVNT